MSSFFLLSLRIFYTPVNLLFILFKRTILGHHVQADNGSPFIRKSEPNLIHVQCTFFSLITSLVFLRSQTKFWVSF